LADYGITAKGFNKKPFTVLLSEFEADLKSAELFGENIDFSDQDPLKQFSVPIIERFAVLWELAEQVFYSGSPKYAEGVPLSYAGKNIGISRKQATKSKGIVRFTGSPGTNIPINYQVATDTNIYYATTETKVIPTGGYIDVNVEAILAGENGDTATNTITKIVNPIIGLSSITNQAATAGGQDEESDVLFRNRYQDSTASGAGSTVDAIRANVLKVTDVQDAIVTENDTESTVNSIPAKSFLTLVKGGDNTAVAMAIFQKKPAGIKSYGTTTTNITDTQGISHAISFSRPTNVNVWIEVNTTVDSNYPVDGNDLIKAAILNYINSIKLGEDVLIYKLITLISNLGLNGILDLSIELSTDGSSYAASNVTIDSDEVAVTELAKITIV
jgi:uncharacterized phage protein gp47/JayE